MPPSQVLIFSSRTPSWFMTRIFPKTSMYWLCTLGSFLTFEITRGFDGSADIDDAETLIVRYVSMSTIFTDTKLSGLVPAVEIAVRENSEILHLAVTRLLLLGAAEDGSLRLAQRCICP